jgi:protein-disulfide isomerase
MTSIRLACILAMAIGLIGCEPVTSSAPPSDAEKKQIDERVQTYFKKVANLPPNVTLKVVDIKPAELSGVLTANIEASNGTNTQKVPVVVSRDGHYFIQGQLIDLSVDPLKTVMDKINLKDQPMRGNPEAKVTIVEYSDFQCPYCSRAYATIENQVLKDYGDKVRLVYKNFPLANIHPWAESGALAAACARKQSAAGFWKMYDSLFQNQQAISPENVKEKAEGVIKAAGLDVAAFDACFDGKTALDSVKADEDEATALGVRSTPAFFINGRKLEGAVPYENFKAVLDQALAE